VSAYSRGELSIEAYLVRILAGIVRQNGGELRVKGEVVDMVGEPTALLKEWDTQKQEIVLRTGVGSFTEVFKVIPETRPAREVLAVPRPVREPPRPIVGAPTSAEDPLEKLFKDGNGDFTRSNTILDDDRVSKLEKERKVKLAAAAIKDYLQKRKAHPENEL
jgi:hypothetical protein